MKGFHLFVVLILSPVVGGWSRSQPSVGERVVHPGCGVLIKGHIIPIIIYFLFTALEQKKKTFSNIQREMWRIVLRTFCVMMNICWIFPQWSNSLLSSDLCGEVRRWWDVSETEQREEERTGSSRLHRGDLSSRRSPSTATFWWDRFTAITPSPFPI